MQNMIGGLKLTDTQNNTINLQNSISNNDDLEYKINTHYDHEFYNHHGARAFLFNTTEFRNVGYWDINTHNQQTACEQLQDTLLSFIPEKNGRILDVACGMGASTQRLINHYQYPAQNVWAINISEKQLESTRKKTPVECHVLKMNAVEMKFENNFFDNILCIEAAFHFETRHRFLKEAYRILKPGGHLVLSDILFTSPAPFDQYKIFPSLQNHLQTIEQYRTLLSEVGFIQIAIKNVRDETWGAHFQNSIKSLHQEFYGNRINIIDLTETLWLYYHSNAITGPWIFVSAQK